jgi:hypothetical protein
MYGVLLELLIFHRLLCLSSPFHLQNSNEKEIALLLFWLRKKEIKSVELAAACEVRRRHFGTSWKLQSHRKRRGREWNGDN